MSLITFIVCLALIGLFAWGIVTLCPMPAEVRKAIIVVTIVFCVLFTLRFFGLLPGWVHLPPIR